MKNAFDCGDSFMGYRTTLSCTNLLVGKKASTDGSTLISYAADSYGLYGELYHWPAKQYRPGEILKVYEWDSGKYLGEIPQVLQTYNVIGNMNEHQLAIAETTFGGRSELSDSTGIMDYGSLIYITLQRAKNAREAIEVMTNLVKEHGYYSSGESFSIADPDEVWVMEMIGKGPAIKEPSGWPLESLTIAYRRMPTKHESAIPVKRSRELPLLARRNFVCPRARILRRSDADLASHRLCPTRFWCSSFL